MQAPVWVLLIALFLSRIVDQTFTVMRTISIMRGLPILAACFGFFEVFIWINVAGQVIRNLDTWYLTVVYSAGFAAGNYVGLVIESRIAMGWQMVRVISRRGNDLAEKLWQQGYPVTTIEGKSKAGEIDVVIVADKRRHVPALCKQISLLDPDAFFTIEDVKQVGLRRKSGGTPWGRVFEKLKR
jgi:uncharacterized protein YebE (UPF0316 family)